VLEIMVPVPSSSTAAIGEVLLLNVHESIVPGSPKITPFSEVALFSKLQFVMFVGKDG